MSSMQSAPINLVEILEHAAICHGDREIVSRLAEDGTIHRTTYGESYVRVRKLASALEKMGIHKGDRVATLAWNGFRHLECWFGISGMGAICHTLNPRLFAEQLIYIINHAEDRVIMTDVTFVPLLEKLQEHLPTVEHYIIMTDRAHMPDCGLHGAICYEELLESGDEAYVWPSFPEETPSSLCYTSGTTGNPKGVLYTHRSNILHAACGNNADGFGLSADTAILVIVPMFHANAWGLTFAAPMVGTKLIMPGAAMDGASIHELIRTEGVTTSAAVPTVWNGLLDYLDKSGQDLAEIENLVIGGSAVPRYMIEVLDKKYGVEVNHAWGMTEMSPLGTVNRNMPFMKGLKEKDYEAWLDIKCKQGRPPFGVKMKIVDDEEKELPRDGTTFGRLLVRGPWIVESYYKQTAKAVDADDWFDTGDVATIDEHGFLQITDRAKDVIKSGGEWISSVDMENIIMGHDAVALAAVIGLHHPKWDERPLLVVQLKEGCEASREELLSYLEGKVAKWWIPDDVQFVDDVPLTATGKISKLNLREQFADYQFPDQ
ncbi:long-chain-fatty-acid--CoA ligase [Emcibacter sp.]|uniref:long-chain-fatty-acid--CoA ligase n=1 Tax=Emcibacter sp. TaxID=1979954 RepID=UPI003A9460D2